MSIPLRPGADPAMPLDQLVGGIAAVPAGSPVVTGITLDSRAVRPGWLYVGLPGTRSHGARFAAQAVAAKIRTWVHLIQGWG